MTYHRRTFPRQVELNQALRNHGMVVSTPSQLADAFRLGWQAMAELSPPVEDQIASWCRPCPSGKEGRFIYSRGPMKPQDGHKWTSLPFAPYGRTA